MRQFIALLLCLLALALCACGGQNAAVQPSPAAETAEPVETPEPTPSATPEPTPEATAEPEEAEAPQPTEEPVEEAPTRESNLPGLTLHEAETEEPEEAAPAEVDEAAAERLALAMSFIDRPLEELLAEFGEPESRDYVPSCLGNGQDGELVYDSFTVYTYRSSEGETVTGVR